MPSTIIFYMNYVQGGQAPKVSFLTEKEATKEAYRLCRKEKKDVFVLKAIKKLKLNEPPVDVIPLTQHAEERRREPDMY